jgi:hypothetical protein
LQFVTLSHPGNTIFEFFITLILAFCHLCIIFRLRRKLQFNRENNMKRRDFLRISAINGTAAALPGCGGSDNSTSSVAEAPQPKVVVLWNTAALAAVRDAKPGPPMVARSLAVIHTAIYDAWAAYDAVAIGTRLRGALSGGRTYCCE